MGEKTDKPNEASETEVKEQERAEERALFARYQADPSTENEQAIVNKFQALVYKIVHRFRFSPDQFNDLVQVGTLGLVLAIRRFDLDFNYRFSTFAWQTIQGEIQRYFRDKTWAVNVPRDLKERSLKVFNAIDELTNESGAPTVAEIAQHINIPEETVQEALELGSAYNPMSFLDNVREGDPGYGLSESGLGSNVSDLSDAKRKVFWSKLMAHLSESEARVIRMYYFEQQTQKEIAETLETSQMNVSRIMRRALTRLRGLMRPDDADDIDRM